MSYEPIKYTPPTPQQQAVDAIKFALIELPENHKEPEQIVSILQEAAGQFLKTRKLSLQEQEPLSHVSAATTQASNPASGVGSPSA